MPPHAHIHLPFKLSSTKASANNILPKTTQCVKKQINKQHVPSALHWMDKGKWGCHIKPRQQDQTGQEHVMEFLPNWPPKCHFLMRNPSQLGYTKVSKYTCPSNSASTRSYEAYKSKYCKHNRLGHLSASNLMFQHNHPLSFCLQVFHLYPKHWIKCKHAWGVPDPQSPRTQQAALEVQQTNDHNKW